ncbi:metallopeptidase TldD-related protein [Streptomyces sp. NBC_00083]|uniref:metallopeptidase TldD-related protein n=1 Tax=Streptomyces sp. NBC_00083 TaxID=2975647 RepID=UPI0022506034|nr:metallopeptidase TldD-related protein [Streptomyces sp. NBC_00083]MCX5383753.1 metallopeptidase TldD-related protein [Streptomyces sp. NBC_00083]
MSLHGAGTSAGPGAVAARTVTVHGPASGPRVSEKESGEHHTAPLADLSWLRATAVALHRASAPLAAAHAELTGREAEAVVRTAGRWTRLPGARGPAAEHTRIEALVEIRRPGARLPVVLWQWSGADPLAAFAASGGRLVRELRAVGRATPLTDTFVGPVVLAPETAVHFVHETLGHSLEADNYRTYAAGCGLALGSTVTGPELTVLDGPAPGLETSRPSDDEGHPSRQTPLVEAGVVSGVLTDAREARRQRLPRTGNGRRASGAAQALPRMSALRVARGTTPPADMVRSVRSGLLCRGAWGGGSVEEFFAVRPACAEWIEDGEPTGRFVYGFDLKGRKTTALGALRSVGDDMDVFNPVTGCGKDGQELPVSIRSPSFAFDRLCAVPIGGPRS